MSEENKALVSRFLDELHNQGNSSIVDELVSPSYVNHLPDGSNRTADDLKNKVATANNVSPRTRSVGGTGPSKTSVPPSVSCAPSVMLRKF